MATSCTYCNSFTTAIRGNNFCSNRGDNIKNIGNNAFYLNTSNIQSGEHLSRLTIRTAFNGYHYHNVNGSDHMVKPSNYLIVNEGQAYSSEIRAEKPMEALIVAFKPGFIENIYNDLASSDEQLLDMPFENDQNSIHFFETTYPNEPNIQFALNQIKHAIVNGEHDPILLEQLFIILGQKMLHQHSNVLKKLQKLQSTKTTTKLELYRRISKAKDFIDTNFSDKLTLKQISQEANLSPFHFLRSFRKYYGQTPYRYLSNIRINYAKHLLLKTTKNISRVTAETGFESHSSFGRVFRKFTGKSPVEYRHSMGL